MLTLQTFPVSLWLQWSFNTVCKVLPKDLNEASCIHTSNFLPLLLQGAIGTNITVDTLCGIMTDFTRGTAIQRYADVNSLMLKTYSQTCLDFTYKKMIDDMKKTEWSSAAGEGGKVFGAMKSLFYLTCFITLIAN